MNAVRATLTNPCGTLCYQRYYGEGSGNEPNVATCLEEVTYSDRVIEKSRVPGRQLRW